MKRTKKDFMTIEGVGKKDGDRLFRDWKDDTDYGIIYYEDEKNNFLMRQILPIKQDIELVKKTRRQSAENLVFCLEGKNGEMMIRKLGDFWKDESDEEIKALIEKANPKNNKNGSTSVVVFNLKNKEFIATLDIEPIPESEFSMGAITFVFSSNLLIKRKYEQKLKHWINELLKEKGFYTKGCKEVVWNGREDILIPLP